MNKNKLNNQYTINIDDDIKNIIEKTAAYYNRKPSELLRLLLIPCILDEYAKININSYPENKNFIRL